MHCSNSIDAKVDRRKSSIKWCWDYQNPFLCTLQIWLSIPPSLPSQRNIRIITFKPQPQQILHDSLGLNQLAFFQLEPTQTIRCEVAADLYPVIYDHKLNDSVGCLSLPELSIYLRSSLLITVNSEVRSEAEKIVGVEAQEIEQARLLFMYLLKHFGYKYPPSARGSEAMRHSHQGDCGQYSFLYAAWCRALGIPCRVLFGSFVGRKFQPHAWNEIFIKNIGWIPVDFGVSQIIWSGLAQAGIKWASQFAEKGFGKMKANRLAFSIDPEVVLVPPFIDLEPPENSESIHMGDLNFIWGFQSLGGAAPYLQPCYIRFCNSSTQLPTRQQDYLGRCTFKSHLAN